MKESTQKALPAPPRRWLALLMEGFLILTIVALIAAFMAPVIKGPTSDSLRRPEFGAPGARRGGPGFRR